MLRASFTKHFENRTQPCPFAAKFWSALIQLQMSSPGGGYGNWRSNPKNETPRLQCWKHPLFWCYWNIKYHQSIYFSLLGGILPCYDVNGSNRSGVYSLSNTVILLWRSRVVPPVLLSGNWSWEVGRALPGLTEEVRDSNRNCVCQTLALLSPWDSHLLLWVQWWI